MDPGLPGTGQRRLGHGRRVSVRCARCWPWMARRCAPPCAGRAPCTCPAPWTRPMAWSLPRCRSTSRQTRSRCSPHSSTRSSTSRGPPVTGDALHTQVGHTQIGHGHGRIEKRTVKVVTVEPGLRFPYAAQGIQIVRPSRPITPGTDKRAKWHRERLRDLHAGCEATEKSRTVSTGSATSPPAKTPTRPESEPAPTPWPSAATCSSASCDWLATPTSPAPNATTHATPTKPPPSRPANTQLRNDPAFEQSGKPTATWTATALIAAGERISVRLDATARPLIGGLDWLEPPLVQFVAPRRSNDAQRVTGQESSTRADRASTRRRLWRSSGRSDQSPWPRRDASAPSAIRPSTLWSPLKSYLMVLG